MRVLVVGGDGGLGSVLTQHLTTETDWTIVAVTRAQYRAGSTVRSFDSSHKTSWTSLFADAETRPDVVVNTAAYTNVDGCEQDRERARRDNVDLVSHIVDACRKHDVRLVQLSTDNVFDGKRGPYTETGLPNPINYYGKTKLAAENECRRLDSNVTIVRTMWLYGSGAGKTSFVEWIAEELSHERSVRVAQDEIGNPTLCEDVAAGIRRILELDVTGICNLAGTEILSRLDVAYIIANWIGADPALIQPVQSSELNRPAARPLQSGLLTLRAQAILGIRGTPLQQGLQFLETQRGRLERGRI